MQEAAGMGREGFRLFFESICIFLGFQIVCRLSVHPVKGPVCSSVATMVTGFAHQLEHVGGCV